MKKRGQVTTFMIVGLVILIIVFLLFALKDSILEGIKGKEGTKQILSGILDEIDYKIKDCVDQNAMPALNILGKQGGSFNPINYATYRTEKITYLCFAIPNSKKCENVGLTRLELENELNSYLATRIKNCINIESFRDDSRYEMSIGDFNFNPIILDKWVLLNITYPITLKREGIEASTPRFSKSVDVPLGGIIDSIAEVLNAKSENGKFDNVLYVLSKGNEIVVYSQVAYPDEIYFVSYKDNPYQFRFAVQGK